MKAALILASTWTLAAAIGCAAPRTERARKDEGKTAVLAVDVSVAEDEIPPRLLRRFQPLPAKSDSPEALVELGRSLFFDKRLSKNGELSCNGCHTLGEYGVDHHRTSTGVGGHVGSRNSPTVYNASGHFAQFWDGRAVDVEEQAKGPILNPGEMAMESPAAVVSVLSSTPDYAARFAKAFPGSSDPVTYDNLGKAIGAFERGLTTPGRWDDFLRGDKNALTFEERKGLRTFLSSGCMVCHTGPYLGGSMYERVGVVEPWPNQADQGRAAITNAPGDRMMFKVPSLRNVEKTAPYFHDGSAENLDDAVRLMGRHQLGLELTNEEIGSIVTWLKSLTSPLPPENYIGDPWKRGS
jgi:cytochrome c peroxidase